MAYIIEQVGKLYYIINPFTGEILNHGTSKKKALTQVRLLHMIDTKMIFGNVTFLPK
jgi:hypothetical protein